ncbi:transporter substrate-binding domain-containing protein [Dysgonomonas sp. Marseille-P4361]|uniref:transporter substrate-binding domain-containing protein n=1 Tax=Dysgonomonas sp. Marseille-P4361 TaxID=2161820 RepID=UPI000D55ACB1|nr:transporter substrate-binding domain-containing protein [Dysgonomonas sp. Marseille-P4361]
MSKKYYVILISTLAVILIIIGLIFRKEENYTIKDFDEIKESGVIRIVTDYNSVGYFVSGDTIAGFNYELINLLVNSFSLKAEIALESNLEKSIKGIQTGRYDLLAQTLPITTESKKELRFTEPILQNRQVLVQRKKEYNEDIEPLRSHLDLAGKTLFVSLNSPAILRIQNLSHEIGDSIYIREDSLYGPEQLIMKVAAKEIDYAVCDEKIASTVAEDIPEVDYKTSIGFTHLEGWAVNQNSTILLDSLNHWIKKLKQTKEYKNLYNKYYK